MKFYSYFTLTFAFSAYCSLHNSETRLIFSYVDVICLNKFLKKNYQNYETTFSETIKNVNLCYKYKLSKTFGVFRNI